MRMPLKWYRILSPLALSQDAEVEMTHHENSRNNLNEVCVLLLSLQCGIVTAMR